MSRRDILRVTAVRSPSRKSESIFGGPCEMMSKAETQPLPKKTGKKTAPSSPSSLVARVGEIRLPLNISNRKVSSVGQVMPSETQVAEYGGTTRVEPGFGQDRKLNPIRVSGGQDEWCRKDLHYSASRPANGGFHIGLLPSHLVTGLRNSG